MEYLAWWAVTLTGGAVMVVVAMQFENASRLRHVPLWLRVLLLGGYGVAGVCGGIMFVAGLTVLSL